MKNVKSEGESKEVEMLMEKYNQKTGDNLLFLKYYYRNFSVSWSSMPLYTDTYKVTVQNHNPIERPTHSGKRVIPDFLRLNHSGNKKLNLNRRRR